MLGSDVYAHQSSATSVPARSTLVFARTEQCCRADGGEKHFGDSLKRTPASERAMRVFPFLEKPRLQGRDALRQKALGSCGK